MKTIYFLLFWSVVVFLFVEWDELKKYEWRIERYLDSTIYPTINDLTFSYEMRPPNKGELYTVSGRKPRLLIEATMKNNSKFYVYGLSFTCEYFDSNKEKLQDRSKLYVNFSEGLGSLARAAIAPGNSVTWIDYDKTLANAPISYGNCELSSVENDSGLSSY